MAGRVQVAEEHVSTVVAPPLEHRHIVDEIRCGRTAGDELPVCALNLATMRHVEGSRRQLAGTELNLPTVDGILRIRCAERHIGSAQHLPQRVRWNRPSQRRDELPTSVSPRRRWHACETPTATVKFSVHRVYSHSFRPILHRSALFRSKPTDSGRASSDSLDTCGFAAIKRAARERLAVGTGASRCVRVFTSSGRVGEFTAAQGSKKVKYSVGVEIPSPGRSTEVGRRTHALLDRDPPRPYVRFVHRFLCSALSAYTPQYS